MRYRRAVKALQLRLDWLTEKLVQLGDPYNGYYHKLNAERAAISDSIDLMTRLDEFRLLKMAESGERMPKDELELLYFQKTLDEEERESA